MKRKKEKPYFKHDFKARENEKLKRVIFKHGYAGIGIYWCLIEMLYEHQGYLSTKDEDMDMLAYELRIEKEVLFDIIENYELFKKDKNRFYSEKVLERISDMQLKSIVNSQNIKKRWDKIRQLNESDTNVYTNEDTNVLQPNNESNTDVIQNIRIKEYKNNKNVVNKDNKLSSLTTTKNIDIYSYIEDCFGRTLSSVEYEKITSLSSDEEGNYNELKADILKEAVKQAVFQGHKKMSYIQGILNNWKGDGLDTIEAIKEANIKRLALSQRNKSESIDPKIDLSILDEDYDWLNDDSHE